MSSIENAMSQLSLDTAGGLTALYNAPFHTVKTLYHATDKETLTKAEQSDNITFRADKTGRRVSLFSCKRWHRNNGQILPVSVSPWASNHVFVPITDVLQSPDDFLIPLQPHFVKSRGGKTNIEMLYVRQQDLLDADDLVLNHRTVTKLNEWKLADNPIIQLQPDGRLRYRVLHDYWFIILTPYEVAIPNNATWTRKLEGDKVKKRPRVVEFSVAKTLAAGLWKPVAPQPPKLRLRTM
jgi:hypothetical protein